jgi:hypothetical protein
LEGADFKPADVLKEHKLKGHWLSSFAELEKPVEPCTAKSAELLQNIK